jgi:16S rRNA (uracil1498-N3)-methyltransferase
MRRLAFSGALVAGSRVELDVDAARHAKVLRLRDDDRLELFDGNGTLARGSLVLSGRTPSVDIEHVEKAAPPPDVVLIQALAKGDKLDLVIRMATEIGVRAIYLAITEHAVPRPEPRRTDRWRRIASEAARQSEQLWTPEIEGPLPLLELAKRAPSDADRRMLAARGTAAFPSAESNARWLVIGPEGGLSAEEERALAELGFRPWTLPTGILRTETAAPVALGALLAR